MSAAASTQAGRSLIERYFGVTRRDSTVRREVRSGVTTFAVMSYILFVNPAVLSVAFQLYFLIPLLQREFGW